jgi:ribosomal protein L7/L12
MTVKLSPEDRTRILDLLKGGNTIEAIKLVREISGMGLKESKDFVESLVDDHNKELPEIQQIKKSGCLIFIMVGMISFCGVVGYKVLS